MNLSPYSSTKACVTNILIPWSLVQGLWAALHRQERSWIVSNYWCSESRVIDKVFFRQSEIINCFTFLPERD
ncbi:uncharacterized protein HD556DRAFT_664719 [Suillus plorans]|uniref:Uncharacterized protein n=1 Tax=Suillus plorans TaxID=116603 RepID=A0A9P7DFU8_9AGAM|nr:uncharacterized protein HD556DRAFT_664719 [Suillus plorans]KAG1791098.1 hypothetical protein HD556DRAFT_664719 [Suillus plorans]